jgi:hypothetical protein
MCVIGESISRLDRNDADPRYRAASGLSEKKRTRIEELLRVAHTRM